MNPLRLLPVLLLVGCAAPVAEAVAPPALPSASPAAQAPAPMPLAPTRRPIVDYAATTWDRWTNYTYFPWSPKGSYTRDRGPDGEVVVKAASEGTGSMWIRLVRFDPARTPIVCWRWKAEAPVAGARERSKSGDDAAARIYFAWNLNDPSDIGSARALAYIWGNERRQGETGRSPYSDRIGIVTLRSGRRDAGRWVEERRDLVADYRAIFKGAPPGPVTAIALLTDTDHTDTLAQAWYGPIFAEESPPASRWRDRSHRFAF